MRKTAINRCGKCLSKDNVIVLFKPSKTIKLCSKCLGRKCKTRKGLTRMHMLTTGHGYTVQDAKGAIEYYLDDNNTKQWRPVTKCTGE